MRFALLLAWRESRSPRRLLLLMASVTAGVAALVAIGSFTRNLQDSVRDQARALLGADLAVGSGTAFSPRAESQIARIIESGRAGTAEPQVARVTSFSAMAYVPRTAGARPVQAMAIEGGFPYYGTIETSPPGQWTRLGEGGGVLVDPSLLTLFDARVGDMLSLGEAKLEIRGSVVNYPGDVGIRSALGPRVYLSSRDVARTGLLRFGSRARYDVYIKLPAGVDAQRLADRNRIQLSSERVGIRTVTEDQRSLNNALGRLGRYLSLIGLVALLLGGLGVASAVRALMKKKMDTIAVLRCLGATAGQIFGAYLLQAVALGLVGSTVGAIIGIALPWVLPQVMRGPLPVDVAFAPAPASIAAGLALGAWVAGLFSLLPLLSIRDVPALAVLRRAFEPPARGRRDWRRLLAVLVLVLSILGLSVLQAPSPGAGIVFAASIGVALGALWGVALLLMRTVRRLFPTRWPYVWRQGLANLYRPANQTAMVILALGFGAFLLDTVYLVHHNLLRALRAGGTQDRPNLALFDIQPDQRERVRALMRREGLPAEAPVPIVPMRIASVKGRPAGALLAEGTVAAEPPRPGQPNRWTLRREYRSTYRDTVGSSERIVATHPRGQPARRGMGALRAELLHRVPGGSPRLRAADLPDPHARLRSDAARAAAARGRGSLPQRHRAGPLPGAGGHREGDLAREPRHPLHGPLQPGRGRDRPPGSGRGQPGPADPRGRAPQNAGGHARPGRARHPGRVPEPGHPGLGVRARALPAGRMGTAALPVRGALRRARPPPGRLLDRRSCPHRDRRPDQRARRLRPATPGGPARGVSPLYWCARGAR